jgi:Tfp pilus assembly PilM family ATPase
MEFGGVSRGEPVWCSLPLTGMEIGHVTIPKVPRNQIANAVVFTVRKENPFVETDRFLDFQVQGEVMESGISKLRVLYYVAPRAPVEEIQSYFSEAGVRLTGVSVGPFATQNLFMSGWTPTGASSVANLQIGRDWSRIDVFSGGSLMLTRRGIKSGLNSMAETLMESFNDEVGEALAVHAAGAAGAGRGEAQSETFSPMEIDSDQARKILFSLDPEMPALQLGDAGFGLSRAEKFAMFEPAVERLVRQVERTFEYYTSTLGYERVGRVFVSGGIVGFPEVLTYVAKELGIETVVIDPMDPRIPGVEDGVPPEALRERTSYTLAVGLALSDHARTPNLALPYEAKERIARVGRYNRAILVSFLLLMAVACSFYAWQKRVQGKKELDLARLQGDISRYGAILDQNLILSVAGKVRANRAAVEEAKRRYLSVAVLGDVASRTPEVVRLLSATLLLGGAAPPTMGEAAGKKPAGAEKTRQLVLEGIVLGDEKKLDSNLAGFLMRLERSPLFRNPKLQKSELQRYNEDAVIRFSLALEVM